MGRSVLLRLVSAVWVIVVGGAGYAGLWASDLWGPGDSFIIFSEVHYNPRGDDTDEFVEVGPSGVVTSWAWVNSPRESHPLAHPFAFALVQLDGADTALLHVVDTGSEDAMSTGMRVTPKWAAETIGRIQDIECFVPETNS